VVAITFGVSIASDAQARRGAHLHGPGHRHQRAPYYPPYFYPYGYYGFYYDAPYYSRRPAPPWWQPGDRVAEAERGWVLFERGDAKRALAVFAKQARHDDENVHAQLGYAIASAELGDLERSLWAMRRAALAGADAFATVPASDALRERLAALALRVHPTEGDRISEAEAHFLAAGIQFAAGDRDGASDAIAFAIRAGDDAEPALALRDAIRDAPSPETSATDPESRR